MRPRAHTWFCPTGCPVRAVVLIASLVGGGCSVLGPSAVRADRTAYNRAGLESSNDQLLLNLLRLRDGEAIYMLELSTVLSQFEFDARASLGGWWNNIDRIENNAVNALYGLDTFATQQSTWGLNAGYVERPTISYSPLQGERFASRYMQPIPFSALVALADSGWRVDQVFECCIQRVNELHNIPVAESVDESRVDSSGFFELMHHLAEWQRNGLLRFEFEAEDKDVYLTSTARGSEADASRNRVLELLGVPRDAERLRLVEGRRHAQAGELSVQTRSLLATMQVLARTMGARSGAEVAESANAPRYAPTPWLTVRTSRHFTSDAYVQVRHQDRWHSIANSDRRSKKTFALLVYLSSLRATEIAGASPLLTVPSH